MSIFELLADLGFRNKQKIPQGGVLKIMEIPWTLSLTTVKNKFLKVLILSEY